MQRSVSVVIPAYNHDRFILETIDSVLAQSSPALEIIVVNDGSPDGTEAVLTPLVAAGRIRYVKQENAGQAAARNRGAAMARGEFLAFLDDDDLLPRDSLAIRVSALEADPDVDLVFGDNSPFWEGGPEPSGSSITHDVPERLVYGLRLFAGNPMVTPGQALIRSAAFQAAGGFSEDIWGADDWDLWFRLARRRPLKHLRTPVLSYRLHAMNASRHSARLAREMVRVMERHLAEVPAELQPAVRSFSYSSLLPWWRMHLTQTMRSAVRYPSPARFLAAFGVLGRTTILTMDAKLRLTYHQRVRHRAGSRSVDSRLAPMYRSSKDGIAASD